MREDDSRRPMNLALPTLGGQQLWTDRRVEGGWRIQRNVVTGHYRLLDPRDLRRAWGSERDCRRAWDELKPPPDPARDAPRAGQEAVVLLHGLGRTRRSMRPMADFLRDAGYEAIEFGYASTRADVDAHAEALAEVVSHLPGFERVHFIAHSLGCLVVRRFLALRDAAGGGRCGPAVGRVVMLAPPNVGSLLARRLRRNPVFVLAMGPCGQQIAEWEELAAKLATPKECGVIAGRWATLSNPLLDSAGDLVVSVEETKLEGMRDFREVGATHTFLMRSPQVMLQTLSFLRDGRFE